MFRVECKGRTCSRLKLMARKIMRYLCSYPPNCSKASTQSLKLFTWVYTLTWMSLTVFDPKNERCCKGQSKKTKRQGCAPLQNSHKSRRNTSRKESSKSRAGSRMFAGGYYVPPTVLSNLLGSWSLILGMNFQSKMDS